LPYGRFSTRTTNFRAETGPWWHCSTLVIVGHFEALAKSPFATLGAHAHPATAGFPRSKLPVTDTLADAAIGVPFYRDLAVADIRRIADAIVSSLAISG
jgi:hypothetical protein